MSKWAEEDTKRFLYLYKRFNCLWDPNSPEYKSKESRTWAWTTISDEMAMPNFSLADYKNKVKNIRSTYCQELKKIRESRINQGNMPESGYKPTLAWFHIIDEFLNHVVNQRPQLQLPVEPNVDSSNQLLYEEETYNVVACKLENEVQIFDESGPSGDAMGVIPADNCIPHSSTSNKRKYEVTEDGLFMPAARCRLESASAGVDTAETEFDVFGRSVAAQLNSIPFKQALELELKIQQLITENRLKWYSESNP